MQNIDEVATPTPEAVTREMSRIRGIFEYRGEEDHEDLISYAKEVVRLRSRTATPSEGGDGALREVREAIEIERAKVNGDDGYNYAAGQEYGLRLALIKIDAALALPAAAGWQMVPREPTEAMLEAWDEAASIAKTLAVANNVALGRRVATAVAPEEWMPDAYRAMLDAAPTSKTGGDPASTGAGDD